MGLSARAVESHFSLVLVATTFVGVLPLLAVFVFESVTGITSAWIGTGLGVILAGLFATGGAAFWRRYGTTDLVFSDLLIWGYLRHLWVARRLRRSSDQLETLLDSSLGQLSNEERVAMLADYSSLVEATDPYTRGHSSRVTGLSYMIAKTMGLSKEQISTIKTAAAVHDIGKIHVPREILHKPDRLTEEEFSVIKLHPSRGAAMVREVLGEDVAAIVRHHHERIDGKGYPEGLTGEDIPIGARVIAVADTFDALTSTRPYRPAARHRRGIEILRSEAGKQLDAKAVNAFLRYYSGRGSVGFWATVTALPQRLLEVLLNWFRQAALSGVVQTAAVVGTSVAVASSVPGLTHNPSNFSTGSSQPSKLVTMVEEPGATPTPSPMSSADSVMSSSDEGSQSTRRPAPSPSPSPSAPSPSPPGPQPSPSPSPSPPPNNPGLFDTVGEVIETVVELLPS